MNQEILETLLILCRQNCITLERFKDTIKVTASKDKSRDDLIKHVADDQIEIIKFIEERLLEEQDRIVGK